MAVSKRRKTATTSSRKRKPGAAKKRKVKTAASPATITVKVSGVNKKFTKSSCHSTKTAAQKQADNIRKQGNNARVIPGAAGTVCVYKGGKTSSKAPRALQRAKRARA